jgi:hypothetical protein
MNFKELLIDNMKLVEEFQPQILTAEIVAEYMSCLIEIAEGVNHHKLICRNLAEMVTLQDLIVSFEQQRLLNYEKER